MIDLHLGANAPRWRFLYAVRIDAYISTIAGIIADKKKDAFYQYKQKASSC